MHLRAAVKRVFLGQLVDPRASDHRDPIIVKGDDDSIGFVRRLAWSKSTTPQKRLVVSCRRSARAPYSLASVFEQLQTRFGIRSPYRQHIVALLANPGTAKVILVRVYLWRATTWPQAVRCGRCTSSC